MRHILETRAPEDRTLGLNDKILALREARLVLGVVHSGVHGIRDFAAAERVSKDSDCHYTNLALSCAAKYFGCWCALFFASRVLALLKASSAYLRYLSAL